MELIIVPVVMVIILGLIIHILSTLAINKFKQKIVVQIQSNEYKKEDIEKLIFNKGWNIVSWENNKLDFERKDKYRTLLGWLLCIMTGALIPALLYILIRKKTLTIIV